MLDYLLQLGDKCSKSKGYQLVDGAVRTLEVVEVAELNLRKRTAK
jgi:hypothetical protein